MGRRQRGISIPLFTAASVAIVGMVALALDLGLAYLTKTRAQNALDAAALAGAQALFFSGTGAATTAALAAYNANMAANAGTAGVTLVPDLEFSPTLVPWAPGGANPRYVKASIGEIGGPLPVVNFFVGVLGISSINVGGAAVAGPAPIGGNLCGAIPIAMCGNPSSTDKDCTDSQCFGITGPAGPGGLPELELRGPETPTPGPGNYGLLDLGCNGADCMREGMAGGRNVCFDEEGTVDTKPGNVGNPMQQGLNTRFGDYQGGGMNPDDYPPDRVTTSPLLFFDDYSDAQDDPGSWTEPVRGEPHRRVVLVPIIDCSAPCPGPSCINGNASPSVLGAACAYLTRRAVGGGSGSATVYAQLIGPCVASGDLDPGGPPGGPVEIKLFQDPV